MKKVKVCIIIFTLILSIVLGQTGVHASLNLSTSTGWKIHSTDGTLTNVYRYGPSSIINADGSVDAWFASPGHEAWYQNYTATGTETPIQLSGTDTAAQKFYSPRSWTHVSVRCPSWGNNIGNLTFTLYKWNTDYNTTIAQTPIGSGTFVNFADNSGLTFTPPSDQPAGYYLWVLSNPSETVGVWKYSESCVADTVNYFNGVQSTGDYETKIRYWLWDVIKHKHSTDGGQTWGTETEVLTPTIRKEDAYSCCDPGVIKFGGYYYIGYTSTADSRGTSNDVFVARSTSPGGPYEKWNGSGWGGDPAPFIRYDEATYAFGSGEPSFVEKNGTLYIYYTWWGYNVSTGYTYLTKVATASSSNPNWPGSITLRGTSIDKTKISGTDSVDVKYVDTYGKFIAMSTIRRFGPSAELFFWESTDGITFYPSNVLADKIKPYCHNGGLSGNATGHLDLTQSNFAAYSYGAQWANWDTWLNPVTYSSSNILAPTLINWVYPSNGQVKIDFLINSQATSYKIKYGTTSGTYTNTITGITSSPFTVTGLTNGTKYYFTLVSTNANGDSTNSEQVSSVPQNYSDVAIASASASSTLSGWPVSNAVDGSQTTVYSCEGHTSGDATEWISFDTGSDRSIARLIISNRQRDNLCAPNLGKNVDIQVSSDGSTWFNTDYRNSISYFFDTDGYKKTAITFEQPIYARYVRIYSRKLTGDDTGAHFYLQLAEMKIQTLPFTVTSSSTYSNWNATRLIDTNMNNDVFSSQLHASSSNTESFTVDMGSTQSLTGLNVKPRASGLCFPVDFKLQSSTDGSIWTDIPGMGYINYINPGSTMQAFKFQGSINARYIKVLATKLGSDGFNYALQACQIEVKRNPLFTATASSSLSGWDVSNAADNNAETPWSSNGHTTANNTEWIKLDLGSPKNIKGIKFIPISGQCFPNKFKVEFSNDNTVWTEVSGQNYDRFFNPADANTIDNVNATPICDFRTLINARYIKVTATELRSDGTNYYFQLNDIIVLQ